MIPINDILTRLQAYVTPEEAREVLATALAQVNLPVQESYAPEEVLTIGAAIAHAQQELLRNSSLSAAQHLAQVMAPVLDAVAQDAPHQKPKP
ncbi:MAG: hypothetical protein VKN33_08325 [Candidatus Sericytochromatia bacterium]|nr:hypothetical protein [Candidatus Sericytochromatia bacterium]